MSTNYKQSGAVSLAQYLSQPLLWVALLIISGVMYCLVTLLQLNPEKVKSTQRANSLYEDAIQARNKLVLSLESGESISGDAISAQEKADQAFKELEKVVAEMRRSSTHVPLRVAQMIEDGPLHLVVKTKEAGKTNSTTSR